MRERLLGSGVLGSDDLAVAELVFHELANEIVLKGPGKVFRRFGVRDLDALVKIVPSGEVPLRELVQPRVLEMPDGPCLTDQPAGETDDARLFADDLGVLTDLALGCRALFLGRVGRQRELGDIATHVAR